MTFGKPFFAMPYQGIFRVTCPTPFPGLPHVHVYLAEGPKGGVVVIDTALPYEDSFDRIEQGVRWLGRELTDIECIYVTHAHPDHYGCAGLLQEASGAPVVCHPICARNLEAMHGPDRWQRMADIYVEHGRDPDDGSSFTSQMPSRGSFDISLPQRVTHVDEGDTVSFAGHEWDVYWTPGHEHGHVVFHRSSDGVLLVGDTVLGKITPHIGYMLDPPDPLGQFLDSLEKVASLEPSFVLPGHGRPFEEGAERARAIYAHHEQRLRHCIEILMRRGPSPAVEVARGLFGRDLMFFEERMALAETLSHLEYLRLRGRLHRDQVDGIWHYEVHKLVG